MRKILEHCPACDGDLIITELSCTRCPTTIRGQFRPTLFARLSDENLRFLEIFVKNRGNVKDMERELGVSYWAIRNRLNDVIAELGLDAASEAAEPEDAAPGEAAPGEAAPGEAAPGEAAPREAAPKETAPKKAAADRRLAILAALEAGQLTPEQAAEQLARLAG